MFFIHLNYLRINNIKFFLPIFGYINIANARNTNSYFCNNADTSKEL